MSTVIKAGQAGPLLKRLSTVDLADHLAEAHAVIDEARRRAARVTAEAENQRRKALEDAHQQGYQDGFAKGEQAGIEAGRQAAFDQALKAFNENHARAAAAMEAAVRDFDRRKEDLMIAARQDVLELALAIAEKLTLAIGRTNRDAAAANLERALRLVGEKTDLMLYVNPADHQTLRTFAENLLRRVDESTAVRIVEDESIDPGGCRIETARTTVDATLQTQIDRIVSLLIGEKETDD